jgi:hypothetical protein
VVEAKQLGVLMKLPSYTIVRLLDLIVYSKLDKIVQSLFNPPAPGIKASHDAFRLIVKRRFYLRNLREKQELFQAEFDRVIGSKSCMSKTYLYNDCMEGDEFCLSVTQEQDSVLHNVALNQGMNLSAVGGQQALLAYAMKDTLRQQFEELQN